MGLILLAPLLGFVEPLQVLCAEAGERTGG